MNTRAIGIVVPAYNCSAFLPATLQSVASQTVGDWECVVVDDGSTDGTAEVAAGFTAADDRFRLVRQANAGQRAARNRGYAELSPSCRLVTFMDGDDVWVPDALELLAAELGRHPEAVGVHGLGEFIDAEGKPLLPGAFSALGRGRVGCAGGRPAPWPLDRPTTFATVVTASVIFPPGLILTRRRIYEKAGLFDPSVRYAEDWDLLIRLARFGDLQFIDRVILGYRRHESNVGASAAVAKMCSRVRYKAFHSPANSPEQRRIVRESWRAAQVMAARARLGQVGRSARHGRFPEAASLLARLPLLACRYVRGYPTWPGEPTPKSPKSAS